MTPSTPPGTWQLIPRVQVAREGQRISVPHTGDAWVVFDLEGTRWVRKTVEGMGHSGLQAEALWWLLAREISVSVPDGAVALDEQGAEYGWLSKFVDGAVPWHEASAARLGDLADLGAIFALDAVSGNSDRHPGNILVFNAGRAKLVAIDAANACLGTTSDLVALKSAAPQPHPAMRVPVDLIRSGSDAAAARLSKITNTRLEMMVREACALGLSTDTEPNLLAALQGRCKLARTIANDYLSMVEALR